MARLFSILISLILTLAAYGQTFTGKVVDEQGKALEAVSVIVADEGGKTLAFAYSAADGMFAVKAVGEARAVNFSMMGFEKVSIPVGEFRSGQTVTLRRRSFVLKEVKVRPDKITQAEDTLNYSVAQFQQGQDRSIADVIRNMPGLEVSASGQISFEGKPINKFYIEGMDLMGGRAKGLCLMRGKKGGRKGKINRDNRK